MFTLTYKIVRKGITSMWEITGTWSECMRTAHLDAATEIVSWQ